MKSPLSKINSLFLAGMALVAAFAAGSVQADELHISAASASTNKVYDINFGPTPPAGAVALGITALPPNLPASVRSIVYVANEQTSKSDLVAADLTGNRIVRYAGATGPWQQLWPTPGVTAGPLSPEGLSTDSFGNLFVNRGDFGHPQVWVLASDSTAGPPGAGFKAPALMDGTSFGASIQTRLLETLIVRAATPGGVGPGDLLVLVNDGRVLRYPAANIKSFLAGTGLGLGVPQTLVTATQCPAGHTPTGMAIWPADGSLLVATVGGAVLRYRLSTTGPSTAMPAFASGLGLSLGKIKTFVKSNVPYAVFDQPLRGLIFEFHELAGGCPNLRVPCNTPVAGVATVAIPVGMATTDSSAPTQDCVFPSGDINAGCTLLGGAIKHGVSSAIDGATLVDVPCVVDPDPRMTTGVCTGEDLPVASVCPGFGTTVIPGHLCGRAGAHGMGFALVKTVETGGPVVAPGNLLVTDEVFAEKILGNYPIPLCPVLTTDWATLSTNNEGTIPEGNYMVELTGFCGSGRGLSPGKSLVGIGLQLNTDALPGDTLDEKLVGFANNKLDNLRLTINPMPPATSNISEPEKTNLLNCVNKTQDYLGSPSLDAQTRYACAAHKAWTCDRDAGINVMSFGDNSNKLSAYSSIRGRLANLILTITSRLEFPLIPPPTTWPLPEPSNPGTACDSDTTPPTIPQNLHATYVTSKTLTLSWDAATDPGDFATGVAGYTLYLNGVPVGGTTGSSSVTFPITLNTNTSDTMFNYQVLAYDGASPANKSALSAVLPVTCYDQNHDHDCDSYSPHPD